MSYTVAIHHLQQERPESSCMCPTRCAVCPPTDGEADVAVHLPVCGQAVQGDHRAGGEGRQPSSQLLLLHQDRHGRQGEELPTPAMTLTHVMDPLFTSAVWFV